MAVPFGHELLEGVRGPADHIVVDMHPARRQQPVAFADDLLAQLLRNFVQQQVGQHEVETAGLEIGMAGVLLGIVDRDPKGFGSRVGIAQHRGGDVDAEDFSARKGLGQGQGRHSGAAAQIEDAARPQVGESLLDAGDRALAQRVVAHAKTAVGIDVDASVVDRPGIDVIGTQLLMKASRHHMDVHLGGVVGQDETGIEGQRAAGRRDLGRRLDQGRQLPFDTFTHRVPQKFLGRTVQQGEGAIVGILIHEDLDLAVGSGRAPVFFGKRWRLPTAISNLVTSIEIADKKPTHRRQEFFPAQFVNRGFRKHGVWMLGAHKSLLSVCLKD